MLVYYPIGRQKVRSSSNIVFLRYFDAFLRFLCFFRGVHGMGRGVWGVGSGARGTGYGRKALTKIIK